MTDGPREAMRRFDNRRQQDTESVQEFEQSLRVLHRDAWPTATPVQRDSTLKRKFEDGLASLDMSQFLRLHARNDDFPTVFLKHVSTQKRLTLDAHGSPSEFLLQNLTYRKMITYKRYWKGLEV